MTWLWASSIMISAIYWIFVFGKAHLEVDIWKAAPSTKRAMDLQNGLAVFIPNKEFGGERVPLLDHVTYWVTGGSLHLQLCRRL